MKMTKVSLYLAVILCVPVSAQVYTGSGAGNGVLLETQYVTVEGSPYYFKDWKSGSMIDRNGVLSENLMIRYDSYRDEVQFLKDGKALVVDPSLIKEFHFTSVDNETMKLESLVFRNGLDIKGYTLRNYFNILYDQKSKFYLKIKSSYLESTVNNYGTNEQVKKFVKSETYILVINGSTVPLSKGRKEAFDLFGSHSESLKKFAKDNKLSLKNDQDFASLLAEYDRLNTDS